MHKAIEVFKKTNDHWFYSFKLTSTLGIDKERNLVKVSLCKLNPEASNDDWRVRVAGNDDYAMIMDFHNYSTAMNTFTHVIGFDHVNKIDLKTIGFIVH